MSLKSKSLTMEAVCAVRAANADLLKDPYSQKIALLLPDAEKNCEILDRGSRGMFSRSVVLRSLYFRDALIDQAKHHTQLIVLSAGFDLRATSLPEWKGKHFFSVDHPYSQAFCRNVFTQAEIDVSDVKFVGFDLNRPPKELMDSLLDNGVDFNEPTTVVWEGATYYFAKEAVYQVMDAFAANFKQFAFYADLINIKSFFEGDKPVSVGVEKNLAFLEKIGEPWIGFFDMEELRTRLKEMGYHAVQLIPREDLEQKYFAEILMSRDNTYFLKATVERN
ncbi:class I SAM-dependent methyltransferase [Laceyella tengchongensis]